MRRVLVAALAVVAFTAGCGSTEYDWDRPATELLPKTAAGLELVSSPPTDSLLQELQTLGPGIAEGSAGVLGSDGDDAGLAVFVLRGPPNSLNAVTITIARSLGAERTGDQWATDDQDQQQVGYLRTDQQLGDVRVDSMTATGAGGTASESWLVARPSESVLLCVRSLSGESDQATETMAALISAGER